MRQPNLLFLMTDGQRADTVAPGSFCKTPHLEKLAGLGAQFTRCYAPNPICSPTRASLMTGRLPHSHGMVDCTHTVEPYRAKLKEGLPFWSQTLQEAGYRTAYLGKWHIERSLQLERFGFDTYDVESYHQLKGLVERDDDMHVRGLVRQKGYRDFLLYGVVDGPVEATPEYQLYSDGIRILQEAARATDRPWALFVSSEGPHDPWVVPRDYYERYDPAEVPRPPSFDDDLSGRPGIYRLLQDIWRQLEWSHFAQAVACYHAFCSLIDDQVGRILAALEDTGQVENTIVVFTADHGDYAGAHRLMLKGVAAFEDAYRVPLILSGSGIPAGGRVEKIVSLIDLAPTLVQLTTGDKFPCYGRSLLPLLSSEESEWNSEAFAEFHGQRFFYTQRILWRDHHKYVFNGFDVDELYDLTEDPYEMQNLVHDPNYRSVLEGMAGRMWQIVRETDDFNLYQSQYGMFRFAPVGPEWEGD